MAPAASDKEEEEEDMDRHGAMARAASDEDRDRIEAMTTEALEKVEALQETISTLLDAVGPRSATNSSEEMRRYLVFVGMELSVIVASLRMATSPSRYSLVDVTRSKERLECLPTVARNIRDELHDLCAEADSYRLLKKAARCFRPNRTTYRWMLSSLVQTYFAAEDPCRYESNLQLPGSNRLSHTAVVEASGLLHDRHHLVDIHGPTTNKLLRWLTAADKSLRVMAIVGPVGVGKTTLAVDLYHSQTQQDFSFDCHAKATMSRGPHRNKILLQSILSQITNLSSNNSQTTSLEDEPEQTLVCNISDHLQDKRYFILIDDLCKETDWGIIKGAFPNNNCSSRILITTRVASVAQLSCSDFDVGFVYKMKPLDKSDSEMMLLTKAFGSADSRPPDESMNEVCDEILGRCGGIPLFISGMAGWLKEQRMQQVVQQQESSEIYSIPPLPEQLKQFDQALSSAYEDLPYESKLLSLYMSMFPQGYMFDKERLISKYLIEALAHAKEAEQYIFDLVDRNIITRVATAKSGHNNNPNDDDECQWQVNHFMLQFLASKSAELGFAFTGAALASAEIACGDKETLKPRRLALHHNDTQLPMLLQELDLSQTRSLVVTGEVDRTMIPLDKFIYLVLLDLEGWENFKDKDLVHICSIGMFALLHLSIRNTGISMLPPQIKELRHLYTLDVSHTHIKHLPGEIKELCRLKVLDLSHTQICEFPSDVCEVACLYTLNLRGTKLKHLPRKIVQIRRLKNLLIGGDAIINSSETVLPKIPKGIQHFPTIETLATVDLSECSAGFIDALGHRYLKFLAITLSFHQCTYRSHQQVLQSSFNKWENLESLTIHCGLGCSMEFLGSLSNPPMKLKKFKVTAGRFVRVPQWIKMLMHLTFLQITVCKLVPEDVKILGDLPRLQCLVLALEFIPEEEIIIKSTVFRELEKFSVDCPVPWLTFKEGAMRRLAYLQLKICSGPPNRPSVPSGITNLRWLEEVVISYSKWCKDSSSVKVTIEAVRKEVAKHDYQVDLIINGTKEVVQSPKLQELKQIGTEPHHSAIPSEVHVVAGVKVKPTQVQSEIESEDEY